MKDILKTIITDFHSRGIPEFINRNIDIPLKSGKIVCLIGPRRAGKTYVLYQIISKIKDIKSIVYINFEDERLTLNEGNLNLIIEAYTELYPEKKDVFFCFDEIQEVSGWEKFIRRVYDSLSQNIFITGSSAKMLSKEIATTLRGRSVSYEIFPLSFREYLSFRKITPDIVSTKGKASLLNELSQFMKYGGFPEIVNRDEVFSEKILQSYFEVMLYRDLLDRYNLSNPNHVKLFLKKLLSNSSKEFSINKIYNEFKSLGIKTSKDFLYQLLDYCEDAFIVMTLKNYSESDAKQTLRKSYSIDSGLSRLVSYSLNEDAGRILENIVFLELRRKYSDLFFNRNGSECDFIIKQRDKIVNALQVCYDLNEDNKKREFAGLTNVMSKYDLDTGFIITYDKEDEIILDDKKKILIVPVWKWLLE